MVIKLEVGLRRRPPILHIGHETAKTFNDSSAAYVRTAERAFPLKLRPNFAPTKDLTQSASHPCIFSPGGGRGREGGTFRLGGTVRSYLARRPRLQSLMHRGHRCYRGGLNCFLEL